MNISAHKKYIGILGLCIAIGTGYALVHMRNVQSKTTSVVQQATSTLSNVQESAASLIPQKELVPKEQKVNTIQVIEAKKTIEDIADTNPKKEVLQTEENTKKDLITSTDIAAIIASHNAARSEVGVPALTYSSNLARGAQEWANMLASGTSCDIRHAPASIRKGAGENIWYGEGYDVWSVRDMVQDWVSEKSNYSYENNTCASGVMCGHYTQIVWKNTTSAGCGMAACASGEGRIFVCRYSPAGNIIGQKPY